MVISGAYYCSWDLLCSENNSKITIKVIIVYIDVFIHLFGLTLYDEVSQNFLLQRIERQAFISGVGAYSKV